MSPEAAGVAPAPLRSRGFPAPSSSASSSTLAMNRSVVFWIWSWARRSSSSRYLLVLGERLQLVVGLAADVADRPPARPRRSCRPSWRAACAAPRSSVGMASRMSLPSLLGREAEVGLLDRLLDGRELRGLPRLDDQGARVGHGDRRHLVDGRGRRRSSRRASRRAAPVLARPVRTPANSRASRSAATCIRVSRSLITASMIAHPPGRDRSPLVRPATSADTIEPTGSPLTIRRMLPGRVRSKTTMGSLLSMQSEIAVVSITSSPRFSTSMYADPRRAWSRSGPSRDRRCRCRPPWWP